jgi:hypothetical protein
VVGLWLFSAFLAVVGLVYVFFPAQMLGAIRWYDYWTERRYTLPVIRVFGVVLLASAAVVAYTALSDR